MDFPYTEEHYKRREELFSNPDFTKERRVSFVNQYHTRYTSFLSKFWETLSEEGLLSNHDIETSRKMVEGGFIHLDIELEISWRHEITRVATGKSAFTCEDDEDIHCILHQEDEMLGQEVEDEIWRSGERAEENDPEITIREATACFKFEMPSNDQVEAA
jgi:hypothetical protein